jgi:hypothetical protein
VKMIHGLKFISLTAMGAIALSAAPALWAQQQPDPQQGQQPTTPIPAIRSPLASGADNGADETLGSQQMTPDTRSLTGAEDLSLGTVPVEHSYWQPHFSVSATADSNPNYSTGSSDWSAWTSLFGGVDIHHVSGVSDMFFSYTGGGMFSNGGEVQNGIIQELSFKDKFTFRRSSLSVFEQLGYLPESSFGFAGAAGAGIPGGSGLGLGTSFNPGAALLTPRGQNLSSSTVVEFDTNLSPRTSLTFVGGYSLLRYFENGLANYGDATFQAGYNYQLTRKDTIAVSYQFSAFRYDNLNQSINSNTIEGSYGRRITGRLAFQIAAGPQFVSSTTPITGPNFTPGTSTSSVTALHWTLNTSLAYQLRRASLTASYNHAVNGGSGLLAGAETDIVTGTLNDQVSRTFNASWSAGYSRNKGFEVTTATTLPAQTFSYWFTGVNVSHPFGRSLDVFANYQLQYQDSNSSGCVGTGCSASLIRNQITVGVNFHKQPIPF